MSFIRLLTSTAAFAVAKWFRFTVVACKDANVLQISPTHWGLIMSRFRVAALATVAAFSFASITSAADLPIKAPVYNATPAFSWTGFYFGLNAGYSWGRSNVDYTAGPTLGLDPSGSVLSPTLSPNNFIGGGQVGYNFQTGNLLLGIEADIAWRNASDATNVQLGGVGGLITFSDGQNWVGTVRGRLGWTPTNTTLLYVTGGLAYGEVERTVTQVCQLCGPPIVRTLSDSSIKAGWVLGAGGEFSLNRSWSLGAEYLYMDLGSDTLYSPALGVALPETSVHFHDYSHVFRAKLNYRFF